MKIFCKHCKHFFKVDSNQSGRVQYSKCKSVFRTEITLKTPCPHCKTELKVVTDKHHRYIGIPKNQTDAELNEKTQPGKEISDLRLENKVSEKSKIRSDEYHRYSVQNFKKPSQKNRLRIPDVSALFQRATQPKFYLAILTLASLLFVYSIMKSIFKTDETLTVSNEEAAMEESVAEYEPMHHDDAIGGPNYLSDDRKVGLEDETIKKINSNLQILHLPPLKQVTSTYGIRLDPFTRKLAYHAGVDFKADIGTRIEAAMDGVVKYVGPKNMYGNVVILRHPNGYETLYGHLSKTLVRVGQVIKQKDIIALAGSTGRSTGPHLHFELIKNGKKIDPLQANLLPFQKPEKTITKK